MINICILTSAHSPFDIRIFHKEAKSLAKAGYGVTLIAQHDKDETVDGIRIIPLPEQKNRIKRMTRTVWTAYRKALQIDADIYHFHDPELIPIGILLKMLGKKVVYDVHEDYPKSILTKHYIHPTVRILLSAVINIIEKLASKWFNVIVTATDGVQLRFLRHYSIVIHNYPLVHNYKICEITENVDPNVFKIIYPGGLAINRGITQLIQAIELSKKENIRLLLAGEFEPKEYGDFVKTLSGWNKVKYLGVIPYDNVQKELIGANLGIECSFLEPNYLYSESNKVFEYMSVGLPVLCSNLPRLKEIIEGSQCGMCINPLNPEEIAGAIRWFIEHPAEAKQMGKNGRSAVEEKYNWGVEEKKLLRLYEEISGQRAGA